MSTNWGVSNSGRSPKLKNEIRKLRFRDELLFRDDLEARMLASSRHALRPLNPAMGGDTANTYLPQQRICILPDCDGFAYGGKDKPQEPVLIKPTATRGIPQQLERARPVLATDIEILLKLWKSKMDNNRIKMDALAFVYDTIHSEGGRTWLRGLTNGQVQDIAKLIQDWEQKKHLRFSASTQENLGSGRVSELKEVEKAAILDAVHRLGVRRAAAALGLGKTTVYRKLREYETEAKPQTSTPTIAEDHPEGVEHYQTQ